MRMQYVSLDRVHGLKALRRSPALEAPGRGRQPSLLEDGGESGSRTKTVHYDPNRLSQVLGATSKTNHYGDYISVRCWCAQPPRYSPDLRALRLLMPEGQKRSLIPSNGFFSTPKLRGLPVAAAPMPFSSGSRGGTEADLRSNNSLCASTARNARYCSPCESGSRNTRYSLPSTASHSIGRCSKPAIG